MSALAINGGKPTVRVPIEKRVIFDPAAGSAVTAYIANVIQGKATLSGYLATADLGGSAVQRLEAVWCTEFGVRHAVACNSATSALLAACHALGVRRLTRVVVPTMGMSAAAAAPQFLGGKVQFTDINEHFHLSPELLPSDLTHGEVVIAINLFGRPCQLNELRERCRGRGARLIEDSAQALWAQRDGARAGTVGDVGVYSMNVHKPLNCGEGGMAVTNDDETAKRLRAFINHGETRTAEAGLNLRMPELTAVIALAQLNHSKEVVVRNRQIAERITGFPRDLGVLSDYYCLTVMAPNRQARDYMVEALNAEGVPCSAGYMLMHQLQAFSYAAFSSSYGDLNKRFANAIDLEGRLLLIELCAIDPDDEQVEQIKAAIEKVWKAVW